MLQHYIGRRYFLRNSALALTIPGFPTSLLAQTALYRRMEWQDFKTTSQYDSLLNAIRLMKANTNAADPNSWAYWTNVHIRYCPHGVAYFLAWHRGYLYYFERQLRIVSQNPSLVLPYWNYYSSATIPAEFTNSSSTNPLYVERLNTNVRQALTLAPFASSVTNFQRGTGNAFEPSLENAPHNPVHDIIGNVMSTMNSPVDPIFWLHHANIDRLWVAWVAAGGKRRMPAQTNGYWSGNHTYANTLTLPRRSTYETRIALQYSYQNEVMPNSLPIAAAGGARFAKVQASPGNLMRSIPATGSFRISGPRPISPENFSLGGAMNVGLEKRSISAQLPVDGEHWSALQEIARGNAVSLRGNTVKFRGAHLVLDQVELAEDGKNGGYFYQIYLNVPSGEPGENKPVSLLLGTLGAFQIRGAAHHGHGPVKLRYSLRDVLPTTPSLKVGIVSISFVRVDGDNSPVGKTIDVGEVRLELTAEE